MTPAFKISLSTIVAQIERPRSLRSQRLFKVGGLHALVRQSAAIHPRGRSQTFVIYQNHFLLLVDEFHSPKPKRYSLALECTTLPTATRRRYATEDFQDSIAIHPLADYAVAQTRRSLTFTQELEHGRFLVAITRDPSAVVRVLNGWAIEIRSGDHVYQVLHSNRGGRLRPVGPIQTDARFALVEWRQDTEASTSPLLNVRFQVIQSRQVLLGEQLNLLAEAPFDLEGQPKPEAISGQQSAISSSER